MISRREQYTLAQRTAAVAAALAVVIGVMLLADYQTRVAEDPLNSPEFLTLKAQVQKEPANTQLKEELRELDRELRETYFNRRSFALWGTWLLTANLVVCLVAAKWATVVGRRLPRPQATDSDGDQHEQENRLGRWAVAAFACVTLLLAIGLYTGFDTHLPTAAELAVTEVAALPETQPGIEHSPNLKLDPTPTPTPPHPENIAPEPAAPFPSDEELRRNWPRFRGWDGAGIATVENPPTAWDVETGEGILWKTAVPLPGNNSPVVWGNRVFLSGADETKREVFCFDADSGEMLWQTAIPGTPESTAEVPEVMEATGFAAPTCVTDGRRVYAMFANGDVGAVDFEGKVVWSRSLGLPKNSYGHGASLAMYQDRLIIQFDQGTNSDGLSKLLALQGESGETIWEVVREVPNSWPTPIIATVNDQPQIITCAAPYAIAYSPDDGKEIWRAECLEGDVGPSPIVANGVLFAANEFPGVTAVRADGTGDVTESHVLWEADLGAPDCCSPIAIDDLVYVVASYGILTCYDAKEGGDPIWEQEFDGSFVSSPTLVGDLMYLFDEEGKAWIVKPTREQCEIIAEKTLGEGCVTSPAFVNGRMFIRGSEHLFCIGDSQSATTEPEPDTGETGDLAAWPTDEALRSNWHRFRGFEGSGITSAADIPTSWDVESGESIRWKTELEVVGNNSPIVWGDRVFLSGADESKREVACFNAKTGELLWQQQVPDTPDSPGEVPEVMEATGLAAPTCTTDGRHVFAMFANGDVAAVDFEGKVVWSRSLGLPKNSYGHGASLAMYQDRLIIQFDQGTKSDGLSKLLALQSDSGETVWEVVREVPNSWPTPIIATINDQPQIITCAAPYAIAYSPSDGKEIWRAECLEGDVGPSPVVSDGVLFAANEFPGITAVRADGTGDVTESHVLWEADLGAPDCCSPIATDDLVYVVASYGILTCYDAKEGGDPIWEQELDAMFVSSPTLVGKRMYLFDEEGKYWIVEPSREQCRIVAEGDLGEGCVASPAFQDGRMFLRGKKYLFCIGSDSD